MGATYLPEHREFITIAWKNGLSAREISEGLRVKFGLAVSRSAICGLASRMNLPTRPKDGPWMLVGKKRRAETMQAKIAQALGMPYSHYTKPMAPFPKKAKGKAPADEVPAGDAPMPCGTKGQISDGCQWIEGDYSAEFVMCGHPRTKGRWCEFHASLAVAKPMRQAV